MEKLKPFLSSYIVMIMLLSLCRLPEASSQGNCLIYPETSGERKACEMSYRAIEYRQGSRESQVVFDSAIAVGPEYAYAFYQKSVPYFKRGLLSQGIAILNRAIERDPLTYTCYRAYWYYAHQSYEACIKDLEQYYNMPHAYSQESPGGEINMKMILAMCYLKQGQLKKAKETALTHTESFVDVEYYGPYDNYILGVCYYANREYNSAEIALRHQLDRFDGFADAYYYLGIVRKDTGQLDSAQQYLTQALKLKRNPEPGRLRNSMYLPVREEDIEARLR